MHFIYNSTYKKYFQSKNKERKIFNIIKSTENSFILQKDFMPLFYCLLNLHEGLTFLKSHPDFQVKYSETVAMRIFYTNDINMDNKLSYREFYKSNIIKVFNDVCSEPDINKIREYFSYEHFYVLYCKFWELDSNEHDFLLDKEHLSRYQSHSLCTRAVDRIFMQIPRKFSSNLKEKLNFEDFLCKKLKINTFII